MEQNKKIIAIAVIALVVLSVLGIGYYKYFYRGKQEKPKKEEIGKELSKEDFLNSLSNPEYKDKKITAQDITNLESLKSKTKPISKEERAKELEFLESLKAPIK